MSKVKTLSQINTQCNDIQRGMLNVCVGVSKTHTYSLTGKIFKPLFKPVLTHTVIKIQVYPRCARNCSTDKYVFWYFVYILIHHIKHFIGNNYMIDSILNKQYGHVLQYSYFLFYFINKKIIFMFRRFEWCLYTRHFIMGVYSQYDRFSDYQCRNRVNICDIIGTKCCHILLRYVVIGSKRHTYLENWISSTSTVVNEYNDWSNKYLLKVAFHNQ